MDGKLKEEAPDKGILIKGRPRIFPSKVGDEELDRILRVEGGGNLTKTGPCGHMVSERVKPVPFAIAAPLAKQACDLVEHDCHCTLLSFFPRDWKILEARTNCSLQPQAEGNTGTNCSLCYKAPTVQGHTAASPLVF